MDLDSIEAGLDFGEVIGEAVDSCAVLVALIGRQWLTLADEEGRRRLDNPDDFVRFEVRAALERGVRVIPVLVDGARPPRQEQLPAELRKLARLNALELSYGRYEYDADRLFNLVQRVLAASGAGTAHQSPATADAEALAVPHDVRPDGNALDTTARQHPEVVRTDPGRAARLIAGAERIAQSITDEDRKFIALATVAGALAATDPDRAERIAQSLSSRRKASALAAVARALAATDPDRAERIAQSITFDSWNNFALRDVARALAATDPDRAERIAQSSTDKSRKARALAEVAGALAATDPDRAARLGADAERIARSITKEDLKDYPWTLTAFTDVKASVLAKDVKARALAAVAEALAATDPDRAERIAQSITREKEKALALTAVAKALAATDPDRAARLIADAERSAQSITDEYGKAIALTAVAEALAATDPDRAARLIADAERSAQSITHEDKKDLALTAVAGALAATDPDRAERIAHSITDGYGKAIALAAVAVPLAATDPDRAERIAQSITEQNDNAPALADVMKALAATDPDRAERIAQSITEQYLKVIALVVIAEA